MDNDRIKGSAEQAKGKVREVAGKVMGDAKLETEGKTDQAKGKSKMQSAALRTPCAASSARGGNDLDWRW